MPWCRHPTPLAQGGVKIYAGAREIDGCSVVCLLSHDVFFRFALFQSRPLLYLCSPHPRRRGPPPCAPVGRVSRLT